MSLFAPCFKAPTLGRAHSPRGSAWELRALLWRLMRRLGVPGWAVALPWLTLVAVLRQVLRSVLLFPTIERMAQSPQGKLMTPLLCKLRYALYMPVYLLSFLPEGLKASLVRFALRGMKTCDESSITTSINLFSVDCIGERLFCVKPSFACFSFSKGWFSFLILKHEFWRITGLVFSKIKTMGTVKSHMSKFNKKKTKAKLQNIFPKNIYFLSKLTYTTDVISHVIETLFLQST